MWMKRRIRGLISNTMWQNLYATLWHWNTSTVNCITEMSRDRLRVYLVFFFYFFSILSACHCMSVFWRKQIYSYENQSVFYSFLQYKKGNERNENEIRIYEVELMPISTPNALTNACSSPSGSLSLWLKPLMQGNLWTSRNSLETSELNGRGSNSWTSLNT